MSSDNPAVEHVVAVAPQGHRILVPEGESVMLAAQRMGYRWPSICGGQAKCGVCFVLIESGDEYTSPIAPTEQLRLKLTGKGNDPRARLACQMTVSGPIQVFKRGVRAG
jgi:ferredoxin, 2Fe-2S